MENKAVSFPLQIFYLIKEVVVIENVYEPPLANMDVTDQKPSEFYVVSQKKVFILSVLSLGLYFTFWSYKNWSLYKKATGADIWPWVRGLYYIFFIHQLCRRADQRIQASGRSFVFDFEQWVTTFVVLTVATGVASILVSKIEGLSFLAAWLWLLLLLNAYVLQECQALINFAAHDPDGAGNSRFTLWNYIVMGLGAVIWGCTLFNLRITYS